MTFGTLAAKDNDPSVITEFKLAKAAYEADGYLIYDFGFSDDLLADVKRATESMVGTYSRVQDLWRQEAGVTALGAHPDVLALLGQLYQRRAFPFQTLNFCVGTQQATHADSIHFSSQPEDFMCGVWVALEDIDMDNGPLHYYPGSHTRPHASMAEIKAQTGGDIIGYFAQAAKSYEKKYGVIKKGQAVIWAANVLHGGDPIKDKSRSRLSQVTHYYFDDCVYTTPLYETDQPNSYIRYPYDFSRGKYVWSRKDGKRVWPHMRTVARAHASNLLKRTPSFK